MSSAYFDRAYGGDYARRNPPYKWRAFLREVLRFRRRGTLLEAGCGFGLFLREAGAHFDCVGCDVSEYAVRQARAHLPAAVPLFCGSLPALELRRGFDVLAAFDVIEHIDDLPRVFANAERLLRPGGLLVFTVPVYDGPLGWLVDRLDHDETHVHRRGRDFWLSQVPASFSVRHYTGVWRYFFFGRFYLNVMSRLSRRWTTAILVVAEKEGGMILVVLPAYNEAEALPPLLARLKKASLGHLQSALSVIVVDDGSTDGTAERARSADGLEVKVIVHPENRGLNEAIRTGLLAAVEQARDDDVIVTMDADDTQGPGLISRMTMLIEEGNDVVVASRYAPGGRVLGVPRGRRLLSHGASALFRLVYPVEGVRDYTCGYRAYRAGLLRQAFVRWGRDFVSEPGFSCMVDILLKLDRLGAVITEAPLILRYDRKPGKSKMDVRRTVLQTLKLLGRHRFGRVR